VVLTPAAIAGLQLSGRSGFVAVREGWVWTPLRDRPAAALWAAWARVAAILDMVMGRGNRVLGLCPVCRRWARWLPTGQPFSLEPAAGWAVVAHDGGGADAGADRGGVDAGA
jgi:hypothetical protein